MPAILISLGGTGGEIVYQVKRKVDAFVGADDGAFAKSEGETTSAQQRRRELRYFLVDTRGERYHSQFESGIFEIPDSRNQSAVDEAVDLMYRSDPAFLRWWPSASGDMAGLSPYLPGDFINGAGQVRVKGKLAYRMHLNAADQANFARVVKTAVGSLKNVLEPAQRKTAQTQIYLVCSLGGGTGSGIVLTLAQHLRKELDPTCKIIGVFLLASVTEKAPSIQDQASIWANTDAALREIDYFQLQPVHRGPRRAAVTPFFEWLGEGHVIEGDKRPFEFIYLFGARNRDDRQLPDFRDYLRLVAECLTAEVMSPLTQQIQGPGSNFIQRFNDNQLLFGRSTRYASAAITAMVYPCERIERHLARRLAARVIRERLQSSVSAPKARAAGRDNANLFLQAHELLWNRFKTALEPKSGGNTAQRKWSLEADIQADFNDAGKDDVVAVATTHRTNFSESLEGTFQTGVQAAAKKKIDVLTGRDGQLITQVAAWLAAEDGTGYHQSLGAIDHLIAELEQQQQLVRLDLDGTTNPPREGLKATVSKRDESFNTAAQSLGSGYFGYFSGNGSRAKDEFRGWWTRYANAEREFIVATNALPVYGAVLTQARRIQIELGRVDAALKEVAQALSRLADRDLGGEAHGGILEVGVLDHPNLVDYHFRQISVEVYEREADALVRALLHEATDGAHASLQEILKSSVFRDAAVEDQLNLDSIRTQLAAQLVDLGQPRFEREVRALNVWDALEAECLARRALPEYVDSALTSALEATWDRTELAEGEGVSAGNFDRYLLLKFIEARIQDCEARAQPFWFLEDLEIATTAASELQKPYLIKQIAYDPKELEAFQNRTQVVELQDLLTRTFNGQVNTVYRRKHDVSVYAREGVAPLFFLDGAELRDMRDRAAEVSNTKFIYTDRRYAGVIDEVISRGEGPGDAVSYALATGYWFKLVKLGTRDTDGHAGADAGGAAADGGAWQVRSYPNMTEAQEDLEGNEHAFRALAEAVNEFWNTGPKVNQLPRLQFMIRQSHTKLREGGRDQDWWASANQVLKLREQQRRYTIDLPEPEEQPSWEEPARAGASDGHRRSDGTGTPNGKTTADDRSHAAGADDGEPQENAATEVDRHRLLQKVRSRRKRSNAAA